MHRPGPRLLAAAALIIGLTGTAIALPAGANPAPPSFHGKAGTHAVGVGASALRPAGEFAPSARVDQLLVQPDGKKLTAVLTDVAVGGVFERGGYSIGKDSLGWWRYASGRDSEGKMRLTTVRADLAAPAGLVPGNARQAPQATDSDRADKAARAALLAQLRAASRQAQAQAEAGGPRVFKFPVLMLATWWDEEKGQTSPQFQEGDTPAYYKKLLDGFGGNPRGTVTEFYYESSFGQFLVQVDVYGPFTSARSVEDRCYYGDIGNAEDDGDLDVLDENIGAGGGGALGMALEVVPQADPTVDFSQYDNNGDGNVDFTAIMHSGADMAVTGDPCNTWSHANQATLGQGTTAEEAAGLPRGTLARAGIPTSDAVSVDRVLTIPEFNSKTEGLTIGVVAHEMGHAIGEPDYYNTTYQSTGAGEFDVMAGSGYFGHPSGSSPGLFNPASRVFQGWVTPTFVNGSLRNVVLKPRNVPPHPGYKVGEPDPNLLLVPVYEVAEGETDKVGHTWTANDVYGLAKNPKTGKYVVEGYYVELTSRSVTAPGLRAGSRGAMFDRAGHGSGLIVWHFDDYRRSNTYFGSNDAQNDSERYQMDVEEFDQNDNTQELQRNETRGGPEDYLLAAATGITSGTHQLPPGTKPVSGSASNPIDISGGPVTPATESTTTFTVPNNPANGSMTVTVGSDLVGDCVLTLTEPGGKKYGPQDSSGPAEQESMSITKPKAGTWTVTVGDFAACGTWSGTVRFTGAGGAISSGAADTWSNWSGKPTGWAFTNVGPQAAEGTASVIEGGNAGQERITLDVLQLNGQLDVSPGFAGGALLSSGGRGPVVAGKANEMSVPVFSNGSKAAKGVTVTVREGSKTGPVVATKTVDLAGFSRKEVPFTWTPKAFGQQQLVVTVDEPKKLAEAAENNNSQAVTLAVGPSAPAVLVVDDDGLVGAEAAAAGALAALGVPYAIAERHPTAALMKQYKAVIWVTGIERGLGQLQVADRKELATYLGGGGNLLIAGNRIVDALGAPPDRTNPSASDEAIAFLGNWLGARHTDGSYIVVQSKPFAAKGTGVLQGYGDTLAVSPGRGVFDVAGLSSAGPGSNGKAVAPFGKAAVALTYPVASFPTVSTKAETPVLGISVTGDAKHRGFKSMVLGVSLAQQTHADQTVTLMKGAMEFFGVKTGAPLPSPKPVILHSPLRDWTSGQAAQVTAEVLGAGRDPVVLHYRRHGLGGYYAVEMKAGSRPGTFTATIPAAAVQPDGLDYYISAGSVTSPLAAASGAYAHGVGIHMPAVSSALRVLARDQVIGGVTPPLAPGGGLPATGGSPALAALALALMGAAAVAVRRSRAQ
jgi:M6 family metalloprotease-like protein